MTHASTHLSAGGSGSSPFSAHYSVLFWLFFPPPSCWNCWICIKSEAFIRSELLAVWWGGSWEGGTPLQVSKAGSFHFRGVSGLWVLVCRVIPHCSLPLPAKNLSPGVPSHHSPARSCPSALSNEELGLLTSSRRNLHKRVGDSIPFHKLQGISNLQYLLKADLLFISVIY